MAIIIGDIHGCRAHLEAMLDYLKPSVDETIVTLGDYVDRGPDTKGCIDILLELQKTHNLIHLKGNHDVFMEDARTSEAGYTFWLRPAVAGQETLDSYGASIDDIPDTHWAFLASARLCYEVDGYICVHGGVDSTRPVAEQEDEVVLNKRFHHAEPHISGNKVICGHTRQVDGQPKDLGHTLCIDTNVFDGGYLTAFDTKTGEFHQVNDQGERKTFTL